MIGPAWPRHQGHAVARDAQGETKQTGAMTGTLLRLASLACALATILVLSLHVMGPATSSEAAARASHGAGGPSGHPADRMAACAIHCLVAAVLPDADPRHEPASHPALLAHAPVRLAGLIPQPIGPPPKIVLSA